MDKSTQNELISHYRDLFLSYGDTPEAVQMSEEGQRFRFEKLTQIADLQGKSILDVGCGIGHLYSYLLSKLGAVDYTGVDVIKESVAYASQKYPEARFICRDILREDLDMKFDYVLINVVFNNAIPNCTDFLKELTSAGYQYCKLGLAFNFISAFVNVREEEMAYHDPSIVLEYCLNNLSRKVTLHHWYERCDVAVFVYR